MIYIIIFVIASILIVGIIMYYVGKLPKKHKNVTHDILYKYLEVLLYRGYDGGFIIIEGKTKDVFLQFKKIILNKGNVILELGFPLAEWSNIYYKDFQKLLNEKGIKYDISPKNNENELEFTNVNCNMDIDFCKTLTKYIFIDVFKYNENELNYTIQLIDVSPEDIKIGF